MAHHSHRGSCYPHRYPLGIEQLEVRCVLSTLPGVALLPTPPALLGSTLVQANLFVIGEEVSAGATLSVGSNSNNGPIASDVSLTDGTAATSAPAVNATAATGTTASVGTPNAPADTSGTTATTASLTVSESTNGTGGLLSGGNPQTPGAGSPVVDSGGMNVGGPVPGIGATVTQNSLGAPQSPIEVVFSGNAFQSGSAGTFLTLVRPGAAINLTRLSGQLQMSTTAPQPGAAEITGQALRPSPVSALLQTALSEGGVAIAESEVQPLSRQQAAEVSTAKNSEPAVIRAVEQSASLLTAPSTPEGDDLLSAAAAFDPKLMEQALREFLDQLAEMERVVGSWFVQPEAWVLMGAAVAAVAAEVWHRRRTRDRGELSPLAFAVANVGDGWEPGTPEL